MTEDEQIDLWVKYEKRLGSALATEIVKEVKHLPPLRAERAIEATLAKLAQGRL